MITINSQTNSLRIVKNDTINLFVQASSDVEGAILTYSWKVKKADVFQDVLNPSANTETLEVLPDATEYGSFIFLCEIKERDESNLVLSGTNTQEIQVSIFNSRVKTKPSKARLLPESDAIKFENKNNLEGLFYNGLPFAMPTLLDLKSEHNIESAIVDLATMQLALLPVGSLIKNKSGVQPTATTQESTAIISGTVSSPVSGEPVEINLFGTRVSIPDGTIDTQLAEIVYQILLNYESNAIYVNSVNKQTPTRVVFRYDDYKRYPERSIEVYGANIDVVITNQPTFCVGRWELLLSQELVSNNGVAFTEYTWERVE